MNKTSKQIASKIAALRKEFVAAAEIEFLESAKQLFEKYDRLKSFGFTAYTNYFNDGDECTYNVHGDYPDINGYGDSGCETENGSGENLLQLAQKRSYDSVAEQYVKNPNFDPMAETIETAVKDFIRSFEDDTIRDIFGDHKKITVTKKSVKVEEYEHD